MTRSRSLATPLVAIAVAVFLSACAPTASADAQSPSIAAASAPSAESTPTPTPTPQTPTSGTQVGIDVDVDAGAFGDESVGGVTFGVAGGDVNCQIIDMNGDLQWGCAVHSRPTWTWDETQFAEYCASFDDGGCRDGLVVRNGEAPQPGRNTDGAFGGMQSPHALAASERITVESVSCVAEGDGVRCEDSASGNGFVLSATTIVVTSAAW